MNKTPEEMAVIAQRAQSLAVETEAAFAKAKSPSATPEDFQALVHLMDKINGEERT